MALCIVNYITRDSWRPHGQARLAKSLELIGFDGELLLFDDGNLRCPPHRETPYAFKLYALKEAQKKGFDLLLWVDASFWAIRNLDGLAETLSEFGLLVQHSGFTVGQWCSDDCLSRMGLDREEAFKMSLFSGGFIGLDLIDPATLSFFDEFFQYAKEGHCFKGAWRNSKGEVSPDKRVLGHRHDMTVGSVLLYHRGIQIQPNNIFFNYYSWYKKYKTEMDLSNVYFVCEGGPRKLPLQEIGK